MTLWPQEPVNWILPKCLLYTLASSGSFSWADTMEEPCPGQGTSHLLCPLAASGALHPSPNPSQLPQGHPSPQFVSLEFNLQDDCSGNRTS